MEVMQAPLGEAGITLNVEAVGNPVYRAESRGELCVIIFTESARFPNAKDSLARFYDPVSKQKPFVLKQQVQTQLLDDECVIPPFTLKQFWMHGDDMDFGYLLNGIPNIQPPESKMATINRSEP